MNTTINNKEIMVKIDSATLDILYDEMRRKRANGQATSLLDIFNIRLLEGVKNGMKEQFFKLKK